MKTIEEYRKLFYKYDIDNFSDDIQEPIYHPTLEVKVNSYIPRVLNILEIVEMCKKRKIKIPRKFTGYNVKKIQLVL